MPAAIIPAMALAYSVYSGERASKAQKNAQSEAKENARKSAERAEQEMNKANATKANAAALQSANEQAAQGGVGGTMLTGPSGVDNSKLTLGKSTLLGQ